MGYEFGLKPAEVDALAPFQIVAFVFARNKRTGKNLTVLSYQTGLYAQADFRKVPGLTTLLDRHELREDTKTETFAQAMKRWGS